MSLIRKKWTLVNPRDLTSLLSPSRSDPTAQDQRKRDSRCDNGTLLPDTLGRLSDEFFCTSEDGTTHIYVL